MPEYLGPRTHDHAVEISNQRLVASVLTVLDANWINRNWVATTVEGPSGEKLDYVWCVAPTPGADHAYYRPVGARAARLRRKAMTTAEGETVLGITRRSQRLIPQRPVK